MKKNTKSCHNISVNLQHIIDIALPILKRNGVIEASIFGSYAEGSQTGNSDIDFLANYKDDVSLLDVSGLQLELEDALGIKVDLVSKKYLKPRLKDYILKYKIAIL